MKAIKNMLRRIHPKRLIALGAGMGIIGLGVDVAASHLAGRELTHYGKLIPIVFGVIAGSVLIARATRGSRETFRWLLRIVGGLAATVGTIGTMFHMKPFLMLLEDPGWTFEAVEIALRIAPPVLAPSAFIGLGLVLIAVASPKLKMRLEGAT